MGERRIFREMLFAVGGISLVIVFNSAFGRATEGRAAEMARDVAVTELKPLQAGLTLPVKMGRTLRAGKVKTGTVIEAKTTQRVPVSATEYLTQGATVRGEVVASDAGDGTMAHPSTLTIRFDQLSYRGQTVPLEARAVAIANLMAVDDTFLPATGSTDRGNSNPASWTTRQVGGDFVARSGWIGEVVGSGLHTVGHADFYGVYSLPVKLSDGDVVPRAMGVFSTTAEGLYGYETGARLESSGGLITVRNPEKRAAIRAGDDMLLEVVAGR